MFPQLSLCLPSVCRRVIPPDLAAYGEGWIICVSQIRPENTRAGALKGSSASLLVGFLFQSHSPAFSFLKFISNHRSLFLWPTCSLLSMFSPVPLNSSCLYSWIVSLWKRVFPGLPIPLLPGGSFFLVFGFVFFLLYGKILF